MFGTLRFRLEGHDPDINETAQRLVAALSGERLGALRVLGASMIDANFTCAMLSKLESAFAQGRLSVELIVRQAPTNTSPPEVLRLPPRPPPRRESALHDFEVRFVDEVGQAISKIEVLLSAGERNEVVTTNAAGVARLEGSTAASGTVAVQDVVALEKILEPRWTKRRTGKAPGGFNTTEQVFVGQSLDATAIKAGVPNTVVIKPKLGKLFAELWDKSGRVRHAKRDYTISGPTSLSATTDEQGRLLHPDVPNGDYTLKLTLKHFEGEPDEIVETYNSPLLVIDAEDASPQVRLIGVVPRAIVAQLHMFFNTNKTFLLPTALPAVKKLGQIYAQNSPSQLLVVGHADTAGPPDYNEQLSLERAEATIAFLQDDVNTWLKNYGKGLDSKKRWGKVEDHLMIIAMPDFDTKPKGMDAVRWYQSTRSLEVDGDAGTETRTALIKEYMSLDDTTLDDSVGDHAA